MAENNNEVEKNGASEERVDVFFQFPNDRVSLIPQPVDIQNKITTEEQLSDVVALLSEMVSAIDYKSTRGREDSEFVMMSLKAVVNKAKVLKADKIKTEAMQLMRSIITEGKPITVVD